MNEVIFQYLKFSFNRFNHLSIYDIDVISELQKDWEIALCLFWASVCVSSLHNFQLYHFRDNKTQKSRPFVEILSFVIIAAAGYFR